MEYAALEVVSPNTEECYKIKSLNGKTRSYSVASSYIAFHMDVIHGDKPVNKYLICHL